MSPAVEYSLGAEISFLCFLGERDDDAAPDVPFEIWRCIDIDPIRYPFEDLPMHEDAQARRHGKKDILMQADAQIKARDRAEIPPAVL